MATEKAKCRVLASGTAKITQEFISGKHYGIDIVGFDGTQGIVDDILAHSDGRVIEIRDGIGNDDDAHELGNYVRIEHDGTYDTLYAHLAKGSIKVKRDEVVKQGQLIGRMGKTGTSKSTGVHLHFVVYKGKERINPKQYLDADLPLVGKGIHDGTIVMVNKGAKNVNGIQLADWVYNTPRLVLEEPKDGKAKIGEKDALGIKHKTATVYLKYLRIAEESTIREGSRVYVAKGAKNTAGVPLAKWVYEYKFYVLEDPKDGKVKIGKIENGVKKKTATVYIKDVMKVG